MDTADQDTPLLENAQVERFCRGFLASRYYRKAIEDIGYVREQAIRDFLKERQYGSELDPDQLEEVIIMMRKNYYRNF